MSTSPRRTPPGPVAAPSEPAARPANDAARDEQSHQGILGILNELATRVGDAVRAAHVHGVPF